MKKTIYKGYLIESYEDMDLVGGPYENNEEREYVKNGKILYSISPVKHGLPCIHPLNEPDSLKKAKALIDKKLNTKRTKALLARHKNEVAKLKSTKAKIRGIEAELREVGEKFEVGYGNRSLGE